ncbi:hypothetical protein Gotur_009354, partial [Gossypium turneri]
MDGISSHWILKNPSSIMKTYWISIVQTLHRPKRFTFYYPFNNPNIKNYST